MEKYSHLLLDLDHTLWDFDANCETTLNRLYIQYDLKNEGIPSKKQFLKQYLKVNNKLWKLYNESKITKTGMREIRFGDVLSYFGIDNKELGLALGDQYLEECPRSGQLIDGALEFLDKVKETYQLVIITNGFEKTQQIKIESSGLANYFSKVFTSESTGFKKPDPRFFINVLESINVEKSKCLVIGDNPMSDILGAKRMGIDSCWVNTQKYKKRMSSTYYVDNLKQLNRLF